MTAKEYLKQLKWIDREIHGKLEEIEYLRVKAQGYRSPGITDMPRGTGARDKTSDVIIKLVDLEAYVNTQTDKLIDLWEKIAKQIGGMEDQKSRVILSCRYLRMEIWEEIEEELSYEKSYLHRLHRIALEQFEHQYPEIQKM